MCDVHGTHNYLSRAQPDVQNLLCLIPKHGKYEFLADLKKFVTLSSFPHYGEKAKNDKVLDYKAVQSFTAMKIVSELYKNMNWLISKSLEFFFNKSLLLLKKGLNITLSKKTESLCRQLGLLYLSCDFIFLFIIFQFVSNHIIRAGSLIPFSVILCAGCTILPVAANLPQAVSCV